jgi:hypothetical protein
VERDRDRLQSAKNELGSKLDRYEKEKVKSSSTLTCYEDSMANLHAEVNALKQDNNEKDALFNQAVSVKLKYENIIKKLIEMEDIKPVIASIIQEL